MSWENLGTRSRFSGTPAEITLSHGESTNRITTAGYLYDANGNLTQTPARIVGWSGYDQFGYDVFDRLTGVTTGAGSGPAPVNHKYDAFGRRIERQFTGGAVRFYFYDMGGKLLTEYRSVYIGPPWSSFTTVSFYHFAGQRLGEFTDRTGNVRYTVYAGGGAWRHFYPFGEEITGTSSDTYKFADLYRDADTGLDYAVNRYNSSVIGRFLSVDKGGIDPADPQHWNRYSYALNDPVNYRDSNGLDPEDVNDIGFTISVTVTGRSRRTLPPPTPGGPFDAAFGSSLTPSFDDPLVSELDYEEKAAAIADRRQRETMRKAIRRDSKCS